MWPGPSMGRKSGGAETQSAIIDSPNETKDFDKIKTVRRGDRKNWKKTSQKCQSTCEAELQLLWLQPSTQMMPSL